MEFDIDIKNYRCFGERPTRISLRQGTSAIVGPNNSGKSNICKFFFLIRPLFENFRNLNSFSSWLANPRITLCFGTKPASQTLSSSPEMERIACRSTLGQMEFSISGPELDFLLAFQIDLRGETGITMRLESNDHEPLSRIVKVENTSTIQLSKDGKNFLQVDRKISGAEEYWHNKLSPIIDCIADMQYLPSSRHLLNVQGDDCQRYDSLIGKQLFNEWNNYTSVGIDINLSKRARILTQKIGSIFGDERLQIKTSTDQNKLLVVFNDEDYIIEELGNGISQFIIIGANLLTSNPSYVFIDEPEIGLHPKLQKALIDLASTFCKDGVIITTHNIGLARSCAEHVYSISRDKNNFTSIQALDTNPTLAEFIGEMSFSLYHELGFSKLLFVEGKSDVPVFRTWLRKLGKDADVMVLPLAGSSGIPPSGDDLFEAKRICENIFLIIDSEKTSEDSELQDDRKQTKITCDEQNIPLHITSYRATENYFTEHSIKSVLGPEAQQLGAYGNSKDSWKNANFSKTMHNPLMAHEMTKEDLMSTDLGQFLFNL